MSSQRKEIPISMDEQSIIDLSNKKNNKNYNRLLYDIGILIKNSDSMTKSRYYSNTTNTGWFDSLTKLSIIETYDSLIGKSRSLSILQTQIENIDNKFKEAWNELVFLSTTKEQYQELSSSIIKKDLSNCKKIIKDSCKIGEKFQYQNKEYEVTQSGILTGIYLIDKIKIAEIKEYLLRGTTFSQVENFKGYMAKFEKYNLEILFGKFIADLVPINKGNYESTFKNNPNRILDKNSKKTISNKITINNYKSNYYSLNLPNYINKNGKEKKFDDTSSIEDYTIEDISPQGNVVCDGAILSCSGSTGGTSPLKIFPEINIFMNEKPIGVISNSKANINILSFGMCKLTSNPAVAGNKNNPVPCMPSSVSPWKDGVSYFLAGNEKAISDKSTCQCSYGGAISIDPNQVGQTFLGYSNGSGNSESGKDDENKKEEKNDDKKEKSKVLKGQENETVDEKVDNTNGQYLLEVQGETKEKIVQRHLKTIGFNLNHKECKECNAYGTKAEANKYKCSKNYKCIDGDIGVKSASALIIFQSRCNPVNSGAQKTGEPNIITGLADDITLESLKKYTEIKTTEGKEIRGIVNLTRIDLIKDWKPEKYETIANGQIADSLKTKLPAKATILPSTAVAWAMLVQGVINENKLPVAKLSPGGQRTGFREYKDMLYFRAGMILQNNKKIKTKNFNEAASVNINGQNKDDSDKAILTWFDGLKDKPKWEAELEVASRGVLKGTGNSNHGIGRAIDFIAGSKDMKYISQDKDGQAELYWLQDNAGRYGFTGLFAKSEMYWVEKEKSFGYMETWHWEYMVNGIANITITPAPNKKTCLKIDCFIKEKRDKALK